jgi:hypothetical protein
MDRREIMVRDIRGLKENIKDNNLWLYENDVCRKKIIDGIRKDVGAGREIRE